MDKSVKQTAVTVTKVDRSHNAFIDHDGVVPVVDAAIKNDTPVLLVGETGTGKTTLLRELARNKGKEIIRVSLNGATSTEEILGKWVLKNGATEWVHGALTEAMIKGDWIVFDEINAALPEVLFSLHSVLDDDRKVMLVEKDGEIIRPHEDFRFFSTMNPCVTYAGTKEMNSSLISRFGAVLHIPHLTAKEETDLIHSRTGIKKHSANILVRCGTELRKAWRNEDITYYCSTRDLISAGELMSDFPIERAFEVACINKAESASEREEMKSIISDHLKLASSSTFEQEFYSSKDLEDKIKELAESVIMLESQRDEAILIAKYADKIIDVLKEENAILRDLISQYIKPFLQSLSKSCKEKQKDDSLSEESKEKYKKLSEQIDKHLENIDEKMDQANKLRDKAESMATGKEVEGDPEVSELHQQFIKDHEELKGKKEQRIAEFQKMGVATVMENKPKDRKEDLPDYGLYVK